MTLMNAPARDQLIFGLLTLTRQWRRLLEEQLLASGLTDATWAPLVHLHTRGDGVTQKELAEGVGLDGSSLVRLLDILEGKTLLERRADSADRRSKRIFLTAKGHAMVDSIRATLLQTGQNMLQELEPPEVEAMLSGVNKIRDRLAQMQAQRSTNSTTSSATTNTTASTDLSPSTQEDAQA